MRPQNKNLKPYQPGQSGNLEGARAHDPVVKAIRRLTRLEIAEIGTLLLEKNIAELQRIAEDPNTSALKVMVAAVVAKAITKGDAYSMSVVLEQVAGRAPQKVTIDGGIGVVHYTPEQLKRMYELGLESLNRT